MTRALALHAWLGPLLLLGCNVKGNLRAAESAMNRDAQGWPRWQRTTPPAVTPEGESRETRPDPREVLLLYPPIEAKHVLHWNATESLRLVLPRSPSMLVDRVPKSRTLGDVRSKDRLLTTTEYETIRCGFGRTWDGAKYEPKRFMVPAFCDGRDVEKEHDASVPMVDDVLDDLRVRTVEAGGTIASDIRCYVAPDPHRLWCEATAEAPP